MWPCCTSDIWIACRKTLSEVRGAAGVLSLWARDAALAVRPVLSVRTRVICRAPALAGPEVNLRLILHRTPVVQTFLSASPLSGVASRMTLLLSHFVIPRLTESGGIRVLPEWPRCRCRCRSGMVPWCQQWQLPLEASHCRSLILAGAPMAHGRATSARASCSSSGKPPAASHASALPSPRHWLAPQDASALAGPSYLQPSQPSVESSTDRRWRGRCRGAWWTLLALWTYLRRGPSRFHSSAWYGPQLRGRRLPLEPAVKLFGPALIAYIELYGDHARFRCAG